MLSIEIKTISKKILLMVKRDQKMRRSRTFDNKIDIKNTREFKKIIKTNGWPKKSIFGEEVSNGAWLMVQHADHDVDFQKDCLKTLKSLEKRGEINRDLIPLLVDRVLVNQGRKQIYGTQFYMNEKGELVPRPLSNPGEVNKLRKKYGLSSLASYKKLLAANIPKIKRP
jgi:N-acyl-D-aspartate/D-glutamate deacylase